MRIGRDHIASTVYTIAFAYAGAALPILIIVMLYDRPLGDALTSAELSEEVIRTLVGSIGLVLAIPVTTLIAVLVVKATGIKAGRRRQSAPPGAMQRRRAGVVSAAGQDAARAADDAVGATGRAAGGARAARAGNGARNAPRPPGRRPGLSPLIHIARPGSGRFARL